MPTIEPPLLAWLLLEDDEDDEPDDVPQSSTTQRPPCVQTMYLIVLTSWPFWQATSETNGMQLVQVPLWLLWPLLVPLLCWLLCWLLWPLLVELVELATLLWPLLAPLEAWLLAELVELLAVLEASLLAVLLPELVKLLDDEPDAALLLVLPELVWLLVELAALLDDPDEADELPEPLAELATLDKDTDDELRTMPTLSQQWSKTYSLARPGYSRTMDPMAVHPALNS